MLDQAYQKTDAGRAEIKARALPLSRSARNLLLVIDGNKPARQWLSLVQGVVEADLAYLLEQGLIGAAAAAPARVAAPAAVPASPGADKAQRRLAAFGESPAMSHEQLYAYLNASGGKYLGAMKRYMFSLEIEQCQNLADLQDLALSLVERVAQSKGDDAADEFRQAVGIRR
ncbi:MAG: hypothetical protein C0423_22105 [Methylibium sp.]|nr:hypothetical protein [Methylibium sp.]